MINIIRVFICLWVMAAANICKAQIGQEAPLPKIDERPGVSLSETTDWIKGVFGKITPVINTPSPSHSHYAHYLSHSTRYYVAFDNCNMEVLQIQQHLFVSKEHSTRYNSKVTATTLTNIDLEAPWQTVGLKRLSTVYDGPGASVEINGLAASVYSGDTSLLPTLMKKIISETKTDDIIKETSVFFWGYSYWRDPNPHSAWAALPDENTRLRVQNALRHAVKLCLKVEAAKPAGAIKPPGEPF